MSNMTCATGAVELNALTSTMIDFARRPLKTIDMLVDMTVYCGLRHRYLSRLYELWERLLTPGHTILFIS